MHVQAAGNGHLDITREFGVQNSSKPPRTQMNEQNLQFYVPDGAKIVEDSGSATTENGNPLKSAPVAGQDKNSYSFIFPLRPGLTQFEVSYQLPYSGSANLDPKSIYPLEHFVVMLPKTMQFAPAAASAGFKLVDYPSEKDASVQVASNPPAGQNLAFKISGEGKLVESSDGNAAQSSGDGGEGAAPATGNSQADNRPGGGLGVPIDAPDPLQKYRWWILGSFAGALAIAGVYVASRQQAAAGARRHQAAGPTLEPEDAVAAIGQYQQYPHQQQTRATSALLEGIKEELFSLELERKQGQISQENYDKAKATLDAAIDLALKRAAKTNFVPPATKAG
jgi:hypothetical protein